MNKYLLLGVGTIIVLIILTLVVLTEDRTRNSKINSMTEYERNLNYEVGSVVAGALNYPKEKYLDKKDIKENKIYDIEYLWGKEWHKGWGRYYKDQDKIVNVNVITLDGGVSIVPFDNDVRFIKLTNVK